MIFRTMLVAVNASSASSTLPHKMLEASGSERIVLATTGGVG